MTKIKIGKGTTFRAGFADTAVEWKVVEQVGDDAWLCQVSERDHEGRRRIFTTGEIERQVEHQRRTEVSRKSNDDFWAARKPGDIVHFENGRNTFVRAEVVDVRDPDGGLARRLKPIALVGDWRPFDLPGWMASGRYFEGGTYATRVRNGEFIGLTHESNVYESPNYVRRNQSEDPRKMDPIDLESPPATDEQRNAARLLRIIEMVKDTLDRNLNGVENFAEEYERRLREVSEMLEREGFAPGAEPEAPSPRM